MHVRAGCGLEIGKASCVEWTEIPPLWMNGLECDGHALWSDGAVGVGAVVARCHALDGLGSPGPQLCGPGIVGLLVRWSGLRVLLVHQPGIGLGT